MTKFEQKLDQLLVLIEMVGDPRTSDPMDELVRAINITGLKVTKLEDQKKVIVTDRIPIQADHMRHITRAGQKIAERHGIDVFVIPNNSHTRLEINFAEQQPTQWGQKTPPSLRHMEI